ncbi:MAG: hypothetical protein HY788_17700 [Deltaproteobacteria bacterium]|nr:hypothetical protein [Deltaproteobacteria bacterium]
MGFWDFLKGLFQLLVTWIWKAIGRETRPRKEHAHSRSYDFYESQAPQPVSKPYKSSPVYRMIDKIGYKNRLPPAYDRDRFAEYVDSRRPRAYGEPKSGYVRNGLSFYSGEDVYRRPINNLYRENNSIYERKEGYRARDRYLKDDGK